MNHFLQRPDCVETWVPLKQLSEVQLVHTGLRVVLEGGTGSLCPAGKGERR
jgi:hypothetical protein